MKMKDIAKKGLKGRQKDTFLIKAVITLAFIFIITSTIFESSMNKTKLEQQMDLYGEWHAAYLGGNQETLERLKKEPEIDKIGQNLIIGKSDACGVIGTFNQDLIDMGRFSLYKGRYPEKPNEIMLELNQMSNMNLDLEVGQKIQVEIEIPIVDEDLGPYIMGLNEEFREQKIYPEYLRHHTAPFEKIGDVMTVVNSHYFYYYPYYEEVYPETIRENGFMYEQKVKLKKEFIITGILQTYTDKWDLGGHRAPNALITEEGGKAFTDALYGTTLGDFSDYEMDYNIFLKSNSLGKELFSELVDDYPNREYIIEEDEWVKGIDFRFWVSLFWATDEEVEQALEDVSKWYIDKDPEEWAESFIEGSDILDSKLEVNTSNFRRNNFSYPELIGTTEYTLVLTIIAVIFIATSLAILQIFLTQMRRRSRRIVLLKSIGATKGQIVEMLFYEGMYFLRTGLFIGIPVGLGVSAIIIYFMNTFEGRNLHFYADPYLLGIGILAGVLALFVGMAIPSLYAVNIPLVGTMSKPPKHKKIKHKTNDDRKIKRQSFSSINWQYFKLNKGKTFISFGISFITIIILLMALLLNYLSFNKYRDVVIANGRPDYAMETFYGELDKKIAFMENELKELDGIDTVEAYKVGKQLFFWYDGITDNERLKAFENVLPNKLLPDHFSSYNRRLEDEPDWIKEAFYSKIYGIDPQGELFNKYKSMITEGNIDQDRFAKGEEVILLIPMYLPRDNSVINKSFSKEQVQAATDEDNRMNWILENSGAYKTSYKERYKNYYFKQADIKPGDTIYLSSDNEAISDTEHIIGHTTHKAKVGGIINYFPRKGVWPFSKNVASYVVISSMDGMEIVYPNSKLGLFQQSLESMRTVVEVMRPTTHGRTIIYINTDSKVKDTVFDAKLLTYANDRGYTLYNYKDSNIQLYYEAFNNALIIALLGITAAGIALIILYNTNSSKMEQDKNRVGILQALGVTREEFSRHYLKLGIIIALLTLLIAHIVILAILFFTSVVTIEGISMTFSDYIKDIFRYRLMGYSWTVHTIICIVYFIITVLIYYLPSRSIINKYPVENIRSLAR